MVTKQDWVVLVLWIAGSLATGSVAQGAQGTGCRVIRDDTARLACYDEMDRASTATGADEPISGVADKPNQTIVAVSASEAIDYRQSVSNLSERWDLDAGNKHGTFRLLPYKPIFALPITYTDHVNRVPSSSAVGRTALFPTDLDSTEAKYQLSFKTKAAENLFGDNGDLWLGYTQSSHWQVYNSARSRPFRETNYEPEAMLVLRTNYELFGFNGTMASIGLNHQSNGRGLPLSRSWNRVIAEAGFERGDWQIALRPWWRLHERSDDDDNPGIENYMGRGEIIVARQWRDYVFSLQARHSLRGGEDSHGSALVSWSFPVVGDLKGYLQVFSGYGESMVDYNHRQTVIGAGFAIHDWF